MLEIRGSHRATNYAFSDEKKNYIKLYCSKLKYFTSFSDIIRTAYGLTSHVTCGDFTTIEDDNSDYNDDRLSVLFHTNRNRQDRGFFMVVTCVSPDFNNINGCTPAQLGQTEAPPARRRRVTEMASSG